MYYLATIQSDIPKTIEKTFAYKPTGNAGVDLLAYVIGISVFSLLAFLIIREYLIFKSGGRSQQKQDCIPPNECPQVEKLRAEFQNKYNLQVQEFEFFKKDFEELKTQIKELSSKFDNKIEKMESNQDKLYMAIQDLTKNLLQLQK